MRRSLAAVICLLLALVAGDAVAQWTTYPGGPVRLPPDALQIPPLAGLSTGCPVSGSHVQGTVVYAADGTQCYATASGSPATWVATGGPGAGGGASITSPTLVVQSDADGTADQDAGIELWSQTTDGALVGVIRVLGVLASGADPGLATWIDDAGGSAVAPVFTVGKPGDFSDTADDVMSTIKLRAHANGDPVGTAKEGSLIQGTDGVLTISAPAGVTVGGVPISAGNVDGADVSAVASSVTSHLSDTGNPHSTSCGQVGAVCDSSYSAAGAVVVGTGVGTYSAVTLNMGSMLGNFGAGTTAGTSADVRSFIGFGTSSDLARASDSVQVSAGTTTTSALLDDATNRLPYLRLTGQGPADTVSRRFSWLVPPGAASISALKVGTVWSDAGAGNNAGTVTCIDTAGVTVLNAQGLTETAFFQFESIGSVAFSGGTYAAGGVFSCTLDITTDTSDTIDVYGMAVHFQR